MAEDIDVEGIRTLLKSENQAEVLRGLSAAASGDVDRILLDLGQILVTWSDVGLGRDEQIATALDVLFAKSAIEAPQAKALQLALEEDFRLNSGDIEAVMDSTACIASELADTGEPGQAVLLTILNDEGADDYLKAAAAWGVRIDSRVKPEWLLDALEPCRYLDVYIYEGFAERLVALNESAIEPIVSGDYYSDQYYGYYFQEALIALSKDHPETLADALAKKIEADGAYGVEIEILDELPYPESVRAWLAALKNANEIDYFEAAVQRLLELGEKSAAIDLLLELSRDPRYAGWADDIQKALSKLGGRVS